jgi:hypothetical protein
MKLYHRRPARSATLQPEIDASQKYWPSAIVIAGVVLNLFWIALVCWLLIAPISSMLSLLLDGMLHSI